MAKVDGLFRVGLTVGNLEEASTFYQEVAGMQLVRQSPSEHALRSLGQNHPDLLLCAGAVNELHHYALKLNSQPELEAVISRLVSAGHRILETPQPGRRTDEGLIAVVEDIDGNRIELIVPKADPEAERDYDPTSPRHLGHLVLWTPQENLARQEAFYAQLGLQVSDRTHIGMSFMRSNAEHHSVALVKNSHGKVGLQHVAFDVGTVDDVMRLYGRLTQGGVECIWGVGRHGPGNNVFSYYRDPAGNVVEFYGDMEAVEAADVVEAKYWGPEHKGDIWGVAGAPPQIFRD